jgi:hypothetical protein
VEAEATAVIARGRVTAIMETVDPAAVAAGRF